jgi:hypothetical protein
METWLVLPDIFLMFQLCFTISYQRGLVLPTFFVLRNFDIKEDCIFTKKINQLKNAYLSSKCG